MNAQRTTTQTEDLFLLTTWLKVCKRQGTWKGFVWKLPWKRKILPIRILATLFTHKESMQKEDWFPASISPPEYTLLTFRECHFERFYRDCVWSWAKLFPRKWQSPLTLQKRRGKKGLSYTWRHNADPCFTLHKPCSIKHPWKVWWSYSPCKYYSNCLTLVQEETAWYLLIVHAHSLLVYTFSIMIERYHMSNEISILNSQSWVQNWNMQRERKQNLQWILLTLSTAFE